jgi:hypothetical protein
MNLERSRGELELRRQPFARQAARFGLLVQRVSNRCRSAPLRERRHDHDVLLGPKPQPDLVARFDRLRRLRAFPIHRNLAPGNCVAGERPRLIEARGPQPLVDSHPVGFVGVAHRVLDYINGRRA